MLFATMNFTTNITFSQSHKVLIGTLLFLKSMRNLLQSFPDLLFSFHSLMKSSSVSILTSNLEMTLCLSLVSVWCKSVVTCLVSCSAFYRLCTLHLEFELSSNSQQFSQLTRIHHTLPHLPSLLLILCCPNRPTCSLGVP